MSSDHPTLGLALLACLALSACANLGDRNIERAQALRTALALEDYDAARALTSADPRRWWDERSGDGRPWSIGPGSTGPWAAWDREFDTRSEILGWEAAGDRATLVIRETNDYFRLLERGWVTTEITYFFDDHGRIEGKLIAPRGDRPPGRTAEFLDWAGTHEPDELTELMPDGAIDPTGDHPERFRALLERWRSVVE